MEMMFMPWNCGGTVCDFAHDVIMGDLETDEPWLRLDAYLKQIWRRADGRWVWAVKGQSAIAGKRSPVWPTFSFSHSGSDGYYISSASTLMFAP